MDGGVVEGGVDEGGVDEEDGVLPVALPQEGVDFEMAKSEAEPPKLFARETTT